MNMHTHTQTYMPYIHRHVCRETYTIHTGVYTHEHTQTQTYTCMNTHTLTLIYTILWQGFLKNVFLNTLKSKEKVFFFYVPSDFVYYKIKQ